MSQNDSREYDSLPYPSYPFTKSHPDYMHTIAVLLGMQPKPVEDCQVLELGCAAGGNLIPMAYSLPQSRFLGIDFSSQEIEEGQAQIDALGLNNIKLEKQNILEFEGHKGEFDYIIVHGVYSWVPQDVRDKVMQICQASLAEHGVAFISYNTYPGWALADVMREMMRFHTRGIDHRPKKIVSAKEFVAFMAESMEDRHGPYGEYIKLYHEHSMGEGLFTDLYSDGEAFLHDDLATVNQPVYFHQFAEHAGRYGLQYLSEAEDSGSMLSKIPSNVARKTGDLAGNLIEQEQYLDFLLNRKYRQSLLCHREIVLKRRLDAELVKKFRLASPVRPMSDKPDLTGSSLESFATPGKEIFSTNHALTKAAFYQLGKRWPEWVQFEELENDAQMILLSKGKDQLPAHEASILAVNLLRAHLNSSKLMEFHSMKAKFTLQVPAKPLASRLARLQAKNGQVMGTNLKHDVVRLDKVSIQLLPYLDGEHDFEDLINVLLAAIERGDLKLTRNKCVTGIGHEAREFLEQNLVKKLGMFAYNALIVSKAFRTGQTPLPGLRRD